MLVYGDHHFEGELHALRKRLRSLVSHACDHQRHLDSLRTLLIICGQVEQGAQDALVQWGHPQQADPFRAQFHLATTYAAEAFYSIAWRQPIALPPPLTDTGTALNRLRQMLDRLADAPNLRLTVKLPEGFNIYALYPEQYLAAAATWLAEHRRQQARGAVVVGIRSIGTALAAVVSTVLRAAGWQVQSLTVRPAGHPYTRQVEIGGVRFDPAALGLIVDEGPGLSGSSMAATAAALVEAGLSRRNLSFLPGHPHDPGGAGSDEVRTWWQVTPRYVAQPSALTFNGMPLQDALKAALPEPVMHVEDFSSGLWRQHVYADANAWPSVCTAFERIKYRYTLQSGRKVMLKFLGLASMSPDLTSTAESAAAVLRERAAQQLAPPVLGMAYGFIATEWVEGQPLHPGDLSPARVDALAAYIARVAGPPMPDDEAHTAIERLAEMLYVNARESLGAEAADRALRTRGALASPPAQTYGDGRMQPYEWIALQGQRLFKVDGVGHECDHTLIGRQSVAWDIAGALVEWRLNADATARLLKAFEAAGGPTLDPGTLGFYRAAYLAFRLGQCSLAAQMHDPAERDRLLGAYAWYQAQLAEFLGVALPAQAV